MFGCITVGESFNDRQDVLTISTIRVDAFGDVIAVKLRRLMAPTFQCQTGALV